MANVRFDTLPAELIAQIAISCNAYSVLQLAATSHKIRTASYDVLVFKQIIERSQATHWQNDYLDIAAIERRCGKDVAAWAHYALADELTISHKQEVQMNSVAVAATRVAEALNQSKVWRTWAAEARAAGYRGILMTWLPELFLVRHPSMNDVFFWDELLDSHSTAVNERYAFCLALSVLGSKYSPQTVIQLERKLTSPQHQMKLVLGEQICDYLWTLAWTIIQIRNGIKNRQSIWPFDDAARVPHISPPSISAMPLQPLRDDYDLPLPFSGQFDHWLEDQVKCMAAEEYITTGHWQGYYTYFGHFHLAASARQFDPPMKNIQFTRDSLDGLELVASGAPDSLYVVAEDCHDGIDSFTVKGSMMKIDGDMRFKGTKTYTHGRNYWDWNLRMTPFGLVGFWGRASSQGFRRNGSMWLWKVED